MNRTVCFALLIALSGGASWAEGTASVSPPKPTGPVASQCASEIQKFCADKQHFSGEVRRCLEARPSDLSEQCRQALASTGAGRHGRQRAGRAPAGFVTNIDKATLENKNFRKVLYTGDHSQLVVMSLKPGEEIGLETHKVDQFFRIEQGNATLKMGGKEFKVGRDSAFIVPAGTEHNVTNTGNEDLKLYTIYSPAQHPPGTIHQTKADAENAESRHG